MYTNITENCKNVIKRSSRTFAASFVIDQTKYSDIKKINLSVPSTANGRVTIGGTISNSVEIIAEKASVLHGQKMEVFNSVKLDSGEYEDIPMGHFKITSARTKDNLTTIVASGPLSTETSLGYFSELEYPATTIQILNEISQAIGVEIETDNLETIYVEIKPEGYTHREVIGFIAAIHAMNAVETRNGTIAFKWFTDCTEDIFTDKTDSPELSNSLFVVNKFECATGSSTWIKGNGSTGIVISNPLMTEEMVDYVWQKLQGFSYRPGTFNIKSGTPCVDIWDSFLYDKERVIATELQHVYDGGFQNTYKSSGETETSDRYKGPLATKLDRYYAELLIVKEIAADSMTVDEADIRYARMDQLDVIEANITSAVVESIDGRYATFDSLNTLNAEINILKVDALTSESALIKELQAGVTKTNTLIFGAAGGTSIQTEFSNSVIAVLGDAQIKSAMIDSVSASKVTAGTIFTDDVTIQSKDGKTLLKDNTMQISDGTRVRVQIGKDASNDYSINVWDASGNLMFSKGGITDHAIKEAIIRDDMVSDNANINAAKLDIDSLFTEINGSTNTIKSTKVYFDSEKQTLDAVFESMTTTVNELQTTQSSFGTQLTAIQGQITSKIWKEDINTAVNEVEGDITTLSTQYSSLNQTVTGLSSTVSSHTTQINSLDTRVDSAESSITQHAKEIDLRVKSDSIIAAINLSPETALIAAKHIDLVGAVTFSSLDSSTQSKINTASTNASNAVSTANTASTTANTANTNATNALNRATYHYGTCGTAAATAAKVVTLSGFSLYTGAMVSVYFTYANTAASPTLNVNGTGAKSIRVNNAVITAKYYWRAGDTVTFIYNGTYWVLADTSANSILASWCSDNDRTLIDGGKIYASEAFLQNIFSKNITATGTISGVTIITNSEVEDYSVEIKGGKITAIGSVLQLSDGREYIMQSVCNGGIARYSFVDRAEMPYQTIIDADGMGFYSTTNSAWCSISNKGEKFTIGTSATSSKEFLSVLGCAKISNTLTAGKVKTTSGVDLDELNSKIPKCIDVNYIITLNGNSGQSCAIDYSLPDGATIISVMDIDNSGYGCWRNIGIDGMSNEMMVFSVYNLFGSALTFNIMFRITYI